MRYAALASAALALATLALATLALATPAALLAAAPGMAPAPAAPAAAPAPAEAPKSATPPGFEAPVVERTEREGGLIVEDIVIGAGPEIKKDMAVVANYRGTIKATGAEFDSSFARGEPVPFALGGVIKGWQDGVPGMKVGGKRRLTVPAAMAYGEREIKDGDRVVIPANSDLVFEIELVDALIVEDIKEGDGEAVGPTGVLVANYSIKDKDGKELEATKPGQPGVLLPPLGPTIQADFPALTFATQGLKVGGKRKVSVPAQMIQPGRFPTAGSVIVELELLNVKNVQVQMPQGMPRG